MRNSSGRAALLRMEHGFTWPAAGWDPARRAPDQEYLHVSTRSTATYCRKAFPKARQSFEQTFESHFLCAVKDHISH